VRRGYPDSPIKQIAHGSASHGVGNTDIPLPLRSSLSLSLPSGAHGAERLELDAINRHIARAALQTKAFEDAPQRVCHALVEIEVDLLAHGQLAFSLLALELKRTNALDQADLSFTQYGLATEIRHMAGNDVAIPARPSGAGIALDEHPPAARNGRRLALGLYRYGLNHRHDMTTFVCAGSLSDTTKLSFIRIRSTHS
jgi:hypothetical protein